MSRPSEKMNARVPAPLARAVSERAATAGLAVSDVVRAALVREVERDVDRKSRSFVAAWLEAQPGSDEPSLESDR